MASPTIHPTLRDLAVPIDSVRPYGRNPRRGDVGLIAESLERNGQYRALVANRRTGEVLAGNHTLLAARELRWKEIAVTYVEVDDEQAKRIVLVDNRTADRAGYHDELLAELLKELPDLEGSGWDARALDELLAEVGRPCLGDDDEAPPLPSEPRTMPGDLYALGRHRLLCGDARREGSYERLLEGERPDLLWTDPPYGVGYEGKTAAALTIAGDGADAIEALLAESFTHLDRALVPGAALYLAHPAGRLAVTFAGAFLAQGWRLHQTLVWVKDSLVLGHGDYHYQHEPILFGYKPGEGRLGRGGAGWFGTTLRAPCSPSLAPRPRPSTRR